MDGDDGGPVRPGCESPADGPAETGGNVECPRFGPPEGKELVFKAMATKIIKDK